MKNNTNYAKESFLFGTATFIGTMVIFLLLVFAIVPSACAESVSTAHASVSNINAEGTFEVSPVFHKKDDFPECSNDSVTHGTETPEDKNVVQTTGTTIPVLPQPVLQDDNTTHPGLLSPFTPVQKALLLENLQTLGSLSALTPLTEDQSLEFEKALSSLNPLTGANAVHILTGLKNQELEDTLHNLSVYGTLKDENGTCISLSNFSLSLILNFIRPYVPVNVFRGCIALTISLSSDNDRIIEPAAKLLGCSKQRIYTAQRELLAHGIDVYSDRSNKPGAGRPDIVDIFAESLFECCMGAQLDENEVLDRQRDNKINELVGLSDTEATIIEEEERQSQEQGQEQSQIQAQENKTQAEENSGMKPLSFEDIEGIVQAIHTDAGALLNGLEYADQLLQCKVAERRNILNFEHQINKALRTIDCAYHEICQCEYEMVFRQLEEKAEENEIILAGRSFKSITTSILLGTVETLNQLIGNARLQLMEIDHWTDYPYWVAKRINKITSGKLIIDKLVQYRHTLSFVMKAVYGKDATDSKQKNSVAFSITSNDNEFHLNPLLIHEHLKSVRDNLEMLKKHFEQALTEVHANSEYIMKVISFLDALQESLEGDVQKINLPNDNVEITASLSMLVEYLHSSFRRFLKIWDSCSTTRSAVKTVGNSILSVKFYRKYTGLLTDLFIAAKIGIASETPDSNTEGADLSDTGVTSSTTDQEEDTSVQKLLAEARAEAEKHIQNARTACESLIGKLRDGASSRKNKDNSTSQIDDAITQLDVYMRSFNERITLMQNSEDFTIWNAISTSALSFTSFLQKWLDRYKSVSYSAAKVISKSILGKRTEDHFNRIWIYYDNVSKNAAQENSEQQFIPIELEDEQSNWYVLGNRLSVAGRLRLIRVFWDEGKDPTDIRVWINYIIGEETERTYGSPTDNRKCCRITKDELRNAIAFLTGIEFSANSLWKILTKDMGYSGRQCAKMDQIGKQHPLRHEQYEHIAQKRRNVDPKKQLVISIDTKAFVLLGRLKHDNGVLMCSPDGKVYRVADHDFGFYMNQIYPNGTKLIDPDRMGEKAVLHPVGVYCPEDKSGYVSLVLGKDTAESMCKLIEKVVKIKRITMPELESVLILADGGGANMSNGITWLDNLLDLSSKLNLRIDVSHFAPGCSRHNIIEHELWRYISIHWKGKPFLDIEHVSRYICETRLGPNGHHVVCWFDKKKYLTNEQKKQMGIPSMTRSQLDKKADGRISYDFEEGSDLHKWNYSITPRRVAKAA